MFLSEWNGEQQSDADLSRKFDASWVHASWGADDKVMTSPCYIGIIESGLVFFSYIGLLAKSGMTGLIKTKAPISEFCINETIPAAGVYQHDESCIVLERKAERQWQEGLAGATAIPWINGTILAPFDFKIVSSLYKPQSNIKLEEGLRKLETCKVVRLSSTFWLSRKKDVSQLYKNRVLVGGVIGKHIYYTDKSQILEDEVSQEIK